MTKSSEIPIPNYSVRIFWSEDDGGFIAVCPELQNLSAFGTTEQEALSELQQAMRLAVQTYLAEEWDLPTPHTEGQFSGQFRLRLSKTLHEWLTVEAEREGMSLNGFVIQLLSEARGAGTAARNAIRQIDVSAREVQSMLSALRATLVRVKPATTGSTFHSVSRRTAMVTFGAEEAASYPLPRDRRL